jgi:hypothetical protein
MPKLRNGHAPGHYRETATSVEAWLDWNGISPEPVVSFEINYEPHEVPISKACGLVWNCTDIFPGGSPLDELQETLPIRTCTYGAIARAILADIKKTPRVAA